MMQYSPFDAKPIVYCKLKMYVSIVEVNSKFPATGHCNTHMFYCAAKSSHALPLFILDQLVLFHFIK